MRIILEYVRRPVENNILKNRNKPKQVLSKEKKEKKQANK